MIQPDFTEKKLRSRCSIVEIQGEAQVKLCPGIPTLRQLDGSLVFGWKLSRVLLVGASEGIQGQLNENWENEASLDENGSRRAFRGKNPKPIKLRQEKYHTAA